MCVCVCVCVFLCVCVSLCVRWQREKRNRVRDKIKQRERGKREEGGREKVWIFLCLFVCVSVRERERERERERKKRGLRTRIWLFPKIFHCWWKSKKLLNKKTKNSIVYYKRQMFLWMCFSFIISCVEPFIWLLQQVNIFTFSKWLNYKILIQARIAQLVAYRLGTSEVPGSNPGKGENLSVKISNWNVWIWIWIYNSNMYSAHWHMVDML